MNFLKCKVKDHHFSLASRASTVIVCWKRPNGRSEQPSSDMKARTTRRLNPNRCSGTVITMLDCWPEKCSFDPICPGPVAMEVLYLSKPMYCAMSAHINELQVLEMSSVPRHHIVVLACENPQKLLGESCKKHKKEKGKKDPVHSWVSLYYRPFCRSYFGLCVPSRENESWNLDVSVLSSVLCKVQTIWGLNTFCRLRECPLVSGQHEGCFLFSSPTCGGQLAEGQ